ncbi:MAG: tetratricopeptide repeat protein [Deltaproteobacteria bacterium]|nr:tetratricopeptide repeat protein [Deltaproteobacteria bacterium]
MKRTRSANAAPNPQMRQPSFQLNTGIVCTLVFTLALIVRGVYLWEIQHTDAFSLLLGDAQLFDTWAREIAAGNWTGDQIFFNAPLYPYFLALVYSIAGHDLMLVRLIQIGLGSFSCVLATIAGNILFSKRIGLVAGILLAIYPTAIFTDCLIQKEVLALFLMAILVMLLISAWNNGQTKTGWWIGVVLGCLALVRENALVILIIVILVYGLSHFREQKKAMTWIVSCILGAGLILLPVGARNWLVGKEFVLITANSGFNFYIGNHKNADGTYNPVIKGHGDWQDERQDAARIAERNSGRKLSAAGVSLYWLKKTLSEIQADIPAWLRLMVRKWFLVWDSVEISDSESQYVSADGSKILSFLMTFLHFGVLGPLAVFGTALTWHQWKQLGIYPIIVISYMASIALFFVFARFRYPIISIMIPFAAAGLVHGIALIRQKAYREIALPVFIMGVAAIAMNWPMVSTNPYKSNTYYNIAVSLEKSGRTDAAMANYVRSLEIDPNQAMAHNNAGILLYRKGRVSEARVHFEKAVVINPNLSEPHYNLGIFWFSQGDMQQALVHFTRAVTLNPDENPSAYYNLACVYSRMNEPAESVVWLKKAIEKGYRNWKAIHSDPDLENLRRAERYWNDIGLVEMDKVS